MNTTDQEFLIGLFENLGDALAENTALLRELVGRRGVGAQDAPAQMRCEKYQSCDVTICSEKDPHTKNTDCSMKVCRFHKRRIGCVPYTPPSAPAAPPPHEVVEALRSLLEILNAHGVADGSNYECAVIQRREEARLVLACYDAGALSQGDAPTTAQEAARMAAKVRDWMFEYCKAGMPSTFNDRAEDADRVAEYLAGMVKK